MNFNQQMIQEYGPDLYRFCLTLTKDRDQADDLYQDSFVLALTYDRDIDPEGFRSLLFRIAHRKWQDGRRKWARRNRIAPETSEDLLISLVDQGPSLEDQVLEREKSREINQAILDLPDPMREVVLLFYMADYSLKEIAQSLDLPEGTVKSRLHYAKETLKENLKEYRHDQ